MTTTLEAAEKSVSREKAQAAFPKPPASPVEGLRPARTGRTLQPGLGL